MQATKAIGADIIDLFDVIRTQALEYTHTFEIITRESQDVAQQRELLQKSLKEFQRRHDAAIAELTTLINSSLQTFEEKTNYVKKVYVELAQIQSLRITLEDLRSSFGNYNGKLESAVNGVHKIVEREVSEEFGKLERKVAHRLKQDQEDILMFDKRIQALQDYQRRELTTIGHDVDDFKSKISETKYIVDETQKIIELMINRAESDIQSKVDEMQSLLESHQSSSHSSSPTPENTNLYEQISAVGTRYDKRIKQLDKKLSNVINITAIAATLFLILFALVAFKII